MSKLPYVIAYTLGVCLGAAQLPAAEVYKWVDATGRPHFGDRAPAADAERLTIRGGHGTADAARRERTRRLLQEFDAERAEQAELEASAAREQAQRAAACRDARNRDFEYQHAAYLYEWDADGHKRILSDAEHRRARARARADVEKWCE